jgi:hypothetical protein
MNLKGNEKEIVIPMTKGELSEELREFIERDPSFTPKIYSQNIANFLIQKDTLFSTDQSEHLLTLKTLTQMENL